MADFLTRRTNRNPIHRQVAQLPATAGEAFAAGATTPGLGGLLGRRGEIATYDEAAGLREPVPGLGPVRRHGRLGPYGQVRPPESAYRDYRSPVLSVEELNARYGELGLKFDGPMTAAAAQILADAKRAEIIRADVLSRASSGFGIASGFAGALVSMATDPLEVASTFIPFVGQSNKAAMIARLGAVRARIAIGAAEGALGNLITEPFYAAFSRDLQLEYEMADALINVSFGAIFGGAGGAVGGVLARRRAAREAAPEILLLEHRPLLEHHRAFDRVTASMPREHRIEAFRTAVAQMLQGRYVEIGPFIAARDRLLATTTLSRTGEAPRFQPRSVAPEAPVRDSVISAKRGGSPAVFKSEREARRFVRVRGIDATIEKTDDGFVVRRAIEGEFVRTPRGDVQTFKTKRSADKFIARTGREDAASVQLGGREFAVIDRPSQADIEDLAGRGERLTLAPSIDTRAPEVLRDARLRIHAAAKETVYGGMFATREEAEAFIRHEPTPARDFSGDPDAARMADEIEDFDPITATDDDLAAQIADLRARDALPEGAEEALAEADEFTKQAQAADRAVRAAAACLIG